VIEAVVAPVDHSKFEPVAVNTELPQLFVTETGGAAGTGVGVKVMEAHVKAVSFTHPAPSSPLT
jgi:hypothetical protein